MLLQEVTAGFVRASTLDQVEAVLARSLERLADDPAREGRAQGPDDLSAVTDGAAFVASAADARCSVEDRQLLDILASQCAIAAQRAKALARTVDIAEQLQSSLAASPLPALEQLRSRGALRPRGRRARARGR